MKHVLLIITLLLSANCIAQNRFTKIVAQADSVFHKKFSTQNLTFSRDSGKELIRLYPSTVYSNITFYKRIKDIPCTFHAITITSKGKHLNLDIVGDSMKVSGDLKLDSAAMQFFKYVIEHNSRKIDSLKNEIRKLKYRK